MVWKRLSLEIKKHLNYEKTKKDFENKLKFKEEEIEEIKQDLRRLENIHSKSMEGFHKEKTKHNSEICLLEDEFEKQKTKLVEQIRGLENELEIIMKENKI